MIKICKIHGETKFTGSRKRCGKCQSIAVSKRRKLVKLKAVNYKGGKCEICGYNKCMEALDFHHENPDIKEFSIGSGNLLGWNTIKAELDKCKLLCSNCHREIHSEINQR